MNFFGAIISWNDDDGYNEYEVGELKNVNGTEYYHCEPTENSNREFYVPIGLTAEDIELTATSIKPTE